MNLCQGMLSYFFIVVTLNMIKFAVGEHEPLYFTGIGNKFTFIYNAKYDDTGKHYIVQAPNQKILIACPSQDENSNMLDIEYMEENEAPGLLLCKKPIKSDIYESVAVRKNNEEYKAVGFAINLILKPRSEVIDQTSSKDVTDDPALKKLQENLHYIPEKTPEDEIESNEPQQVPNTRYKVLELIVFKFDDKNKRIKFACHDIALGNLLTPEINRNGNESYESNKEIYGYNVESLYTLKGPYVKVPLIPEEDFFFESWKSASRQNVLTAAMRRELVPQWRKLEIFIRKVTQVIDLLGAITGIYGTLNQFDEESQQTIYLHDETYPIPQLFWKVVGIDFNYDKINYRKGILFVLHNVNPKTNQVVQKICPDDDVSNAGWEFLNDVKFTHLMYACFWNQKNMLALEEMGHVRSDVLDLKEVPLVRIDKNNERVFETVNVIEIINQNSGLNRIVNYIVDMIFYPYRFLSYYL